MWEDSKPGAIGEVACSAKVVGGRWDPYASCSPERCGEGKWGYILCLDVWEVWVERVSQSWLDVRLKRRAIFVDHGRDLAFSKHVVSVRSMSRFLT